MSPLVSEKKLKYAFVRKLALCAKSDRTVSNVCQNKYILAISSDKGVISLSRQEMWKFCNNLTGHFEYSLKVILREFWGPTGS